MKAYRMAAFLGWVECNSYGSILHLCPMCKMDPRPYWWTQDTPRRHPDSSDEPLAIDVSTLTPDEAKLIQGIRDFEPKTYSCGCPVKESDKAFCDTHLKSFTPERRDQDHYGEPD